MKAFWVLLSLSFVFFNCIANTFTDSKVLQRIQEIERNCHCIVGVSAIHIESNRKIQYKGNKPFFMASTVKLPIALTLLHAVDEQRVRLDKLIPLNQCDAVPGSGILYNKLCSQSGVYPLSLRQLLVLMLTISDNTASDVILRELKGPQAVTHQLRTLGFKNITVNQSILSLYISSSGLDRAKRIHNAQELASASNKVSAYKKMIAWEKFQNDKRDTATPNSMALLLTRLYQGKLLSTKSTHLLLDIMSKCETGKQRIKGQLPASVQVAHKTGTWTITDNFNRYPGARTLYRFANDIGIITLPHQKGHIAIAIYVKSKAVPDYLRDRAIAKIASEIYHYLTI
jgi:beta-lactamase class A